MDSTPADVARLREKLGESVADGENASDTMFTDAQIKAWFERSATFNHAVVEGWEAKLANFTNLADVTDGAASRKLGDLADRARENLKYWRGRIAAGPDEGLARTRTRVGKIVRNG
jgi:hypothetical protein